MKSRLLVTIVVALASGCALRAQAIFPQETDNAALRYWFAMADVREPSDDATRHLFESTLAERTPDDEAKLAPLLDSNLDALVAMQRATKLPLCNWGFDYLHGARMPVWFGMQARLLSQLNHLQGNREMARGHSQTAVDIWLAGIHFAQDVSHGGPVIVALIANAMILDNLQPLLDSARQGRLDERQKIQLSTVVRAMPEDGFDWAAAWGAEFAIGDQFLQDLRKARKSKSDDKIRAYEEYMLAAQAALRQPPTQAKSQVDELENSIRQLGQEEQNLIPSLRLTNNARLRIATTRDELLQALTSK